MHQTNNYNPSNLARRRKPRRRKRKLKRYIHYLIVLLAVFVGISIATAIWRSIQSPETLANDKTSSESLTDPTTQPEQSTPQIEESENSRNEGKESEIAYDYAKPVPETEPVENDYFDDAVFIGDSRTEGLLLYTGLSNAISYTDKGLMVDTVFTKPVINKDGEKLSVMDALHSTDFSKVYIMLGINETGWPYSSVFIEKYGQIIDEIKTINPQAIIYVQEILPVTDSVSRTHGYVKNDKINKYNALIRQMAEEKQVYYIDTGAAVSDENGCLPEEAATDGIHLKQSYCDKWLEYLKKHTISK